MNKPCFSLRRIPTMLCALLIPLLASPAAAAAPMQPDTSWPSYNGTVDGQRFSPLDLINTGNVGTLSEVCRVKVDDSGSFHTGPLLIDGTLYITTAHDTLAIDATTCAVRWRNVHVATGPEPLPGSRGAAYANGKVFRGTPDGYLLSIDAATGKTLWKQQSGDSAVGEFFSSAPVVWQGLLITGTAGSDWGVRGRIMAYDADTGREVWRFYTIPRGKEPGAETWKERGTARYGGGGSWTSYTMDLSTGEIFIPVGNPSPDFIPGHRPGANLFTDSMLVLDARTGALLWWHQLVSNDGHDLDLGAPPMLYLNDEGTPMVALGSKNGYIYGVNRETRKRVFRTPITTIKNEGVRPTAAGLHICPGPLGGVEWNGPAYDQKNKSLIVGTVDWCALIKPAPVAKIQPGQLMIGGTWDFSGAPQRGWVHAVDPNNGKIRWKYEADAGIVAGITPTAGGVTFTGDMGGNFLALDSASGNVLLKTQTGGAVAGGVITYAQGGKQYVAVTSGNISRLTFGSSGVPTLILYALGGSGQAATTPATSVTAAGAPDASSGKLVFAKNCAACHGAQGEGGAGPSLVGLHDRRSYEQIVGWIKNPSAKMPKLYPAPLDEQAVVDVAAYMQKF